MAGLPVVYPDTLPHPLVGQFTPGERRAVNREVMRPISRDRAGVRSVAFIFTPAQAREFRDWYVDWVTVGGGFFAAPWPMPWGRGPHVFRFVEPPSWQLVGGGLDGQGYWRVTADVELRGRGEMPELDVLVVTSKPYPYELVEGVSDQFELTQIRGLPYIDTPPDELSDEFKLTELRLRDLVLFGYSTERIVDSYKLTGVALIDQAVYGYATEKIDDSFELTDIQLKTVIIQYQRYVDSLDSGFALTGMQLI